MGKKHNRLKYEKSPYLLQHAYNPVDWYPWGEEAFEKARKENKPVFLSIGYSTCHWCHVMEHESFEDEQVARLMNESFVSIKVDREERPDLDNIYMTICQMLTGHGGWPLTIIMTPDNKPFFAGTYFPKESRFGRMGMLELAPLVKQIWETRCDEVLGSADKIIDALRGESRSSEGGQGLDRSTLELAYKQLSDRFDSVHGGFGSSPKFPTAHNFLFLLHYWKRGLTGLTDGGDNALSMVEKSLEAMRLGGVYDHIGFGFHRYSTDPEWLVPHFEKMLYDQALLAIAYVEAYQATGKEIYKNTAREIFTYVLRDMTSPEGGFYSAEDADSEGEEGKFYLWTEEEILEILGQEEGGLFIQIFNVRKGGNFSEETTGEKTGGNILHLRTPMTKVAFFLNVPEQELEERIESARAKLFSVRENRVHPYKDDKILADWNGLMIAALAKAGQAFDEPEYVEAAKRASDFVLHKMRGENGRLLHRYREGGAGIQGNLDDYVFLIWGLIELYEAAFDVSYLKTALDLNEDLVNHFWDDEGGGFYFAPDDGEKLLVRRKEIYDGALPSGNAVAMLNLLRLGRMTANSGLEQKAARILIAFSSRIKQTPLAYTQLMVALDFAVGPSYEIVIVGDPRADDTKAMLKALRSRFIPNKVMLLRPVEEESPAIVGIAKFTEDQRSLDGKATAYVCRNYVCELPTTDINGMLELLREK